MKIFLSFVAVFLSGACISQPVARLPFSKKISIDDGLSSYNVKKILQDRYGFIWIATQDGLNRYDGKNFSIYNKSTEHRHRLLANDIWDLEEDSLRNILWVVTSYGGLNAIDLKTSFVCLSVQAGLPQQGFPHEWLRCIRQYKDDLWIGTYDGPAVYNVSTHAFERFDSLPFKKRPATIYCIDKIFIDQYEHVWLFIANYGIAVYSAATRKVLGYYLLQELSLQNEATYKQFNSVVRTSADTLLIATSQGFRRIHYNHAGLQSSTTGLYEGDQQYCYTRVEAAGLDALHRVWFSTSSKLYRTGPGQPGVQEVKDAGTQLQNDWFNYIYDIFFDRTGNVWLGTRKGISFTKNTVPAFSLYSVSQDQTQKIDHAYYLYPCSDSVVYVCTETGLLKVNTYENSITSLDRGKKYYFIAAHTDKNLLVSTDDSFFVYRPREQCFVAVSNLYPELAALSKIGVSSIVYEGDSLALIGTQTAEGFYRWNYKKRTLEKFPMPQTVEAAEANFVNTMYKDKNDKVWILGNKWITLYDPDKQEARSISLVNQRNHIPYNLFFDVCEAAGYYWIAAYGSGVIQLDSRFAIKRVFSEADGLSNTGVYKIFPVKDSLLFVSTNYGLSVLNLHTNSFTNFYKEDGLHSDAFEQSCGTVKGDKIYAGGISGFTIIDPAHFSVNTQAPKLYLNHIHIETESGSIDTSNAFLDGLRIPENVLQTTLSFSALNYSNPLRTAYSYKIQDLNSSWIYLGTQNFVSLVGLGPGSHRLLVRSANENGIWNKKPLELILIYLPKWYQTWWFKLLIGIVMAALLYALYAYRISQLKKQQKIRKDIAADLHDDIGGTLYTMKMSTHFARREADKEKHLIKIEESLAQASASFRDMLWVLDDSKDTVYEFVERIRKTVAIADSVHVVPVQCHADSDIYNEVFSTAEKRNIMLIIKESVNNSLKHAQCKSIRVDIRQHSKKMTVQIVDDGKGFVIDGSSGGMGLKNIYYRAKQIGYRVEIISAPGEGTVIRIVKM